jgi:hypothetical protein
MISEKLKVNSFPRMKHQGIQYLAFVVLLLFSSCGKNIPKKYTGDFYFTTEASSYMGEAGNDSVLHFYGSVKEDSKNTLRIEYAPRLIPSSNNTLVANIFVEGIITPAIDANGNFTYPDYVSRDLHYFFHGGFADNGDINISIGFDGLGAGYANEIHGTRY